MHHGGQVRLAVAGQGQGDAGAARLHQRRRTQGGRRQLLRGTGDRQQRCEEDALPQPHRRRPDGDGVETRPHGDGTRLLLESFTPSLIRTAAAGRLTPIFYSAARIRTAVPISTIWALPAVSTVRGRVRAAGNRIETVVPTFNSLSIVSCAPCSRAMEFTSGSPRPTPSKLRANAVSTCSNGFRMRGMSSLAMPMPSSATANTTPLCGSGPAGLTLISMLPPFGLNLIALPTRLISICFSMRPSTWSRSVTGSTLTNSFT